MEGQKQLWNWSERRRGIIQPRDFPAKSYLPRVKRERVIHLAQWTLTGSLTPDISSLLGDCHQTYFDYWGTVIRHIHISGELSSDISKLLGDYHQTYPDYWGTVTRHIQITGGLSSDYIQVTGGLSSDISKLLRIRHIQITGGLSPDISTLLGDCHQTISR